jgi:hypothetical protein
LSHEVLAHLPRRHQKCKVIGGLALSARWRERYEHDMKFLKLIFSCSALTAALLLSSITSAQVQPQIQAETQDQIQVEALSSAQSISIEQQDLETSPLQKQSSIKTPPPSGYISIQLKSHSTEGPSASEAGLVDITLIGHVSSVLTDLKARVATDLMNEAEAQTVYYELLGAQGSSYRAPDSDKALRKALGLGSVEELSPEDREELRSVHVQLILGVRPPTAKYIIEALSLNPVDIETHADSVATDLAHWDFALRPALK